MPTTITFFPVDNGDMTLIKFGDLDATTLLIDVNIRQDADDPEGEARDVAKDLRDRLKKDENGRPYVDAFLLSHPDDDHCRGLTRHFYLGELDKYPDDKKDDKDKKIVIREMWSSPIVFRRASKTLTLCDDAKAWATEARRRVQLNRDKNFTVGSGDRIQIMGRTSMERPMTSPPSCGRSIRASLRSTARVLHSSLRFFLHLWRPRTMRKRKSAWSKISPV